MKGNLRNQEEKNHNFRVTSSPNLRKGGSAARPTPEDAARLRAVAKKHGACHVLLATWKRGSMPRFYRLRRAAAIDSWIEITNLDSVFR
jgi:hypothetical protein